MAAAHQLPSGLSWGALILAGLSALGTLYLEYSHNDRELTQRVSALEQHKTDESSRLDRIENKVDKLVEWALGK